MKIDKNSTYFVKMKPTHSYFGLIKFTASSDLDVWTECKIVEDRYKLDDGYKLTIESLDGFGKDDYYQSDFKSLVRSGDIIERTSDTQHVEFIKWAESITPNVHVIHEANIVAD